MQLKKNYIAGQWLEGSDTVANINPSDTTDVIAQYALADSAQVNLAVDAANAAFNTWSRSGIQNRSDLLDTVGTEILQRKQELGQLLAREEGKTLPEGIGEVTRAGQIFKYFSGEVLRGAGELYASVRPGLEASVTREAIGTVALITPWNFPIAIPAWKIAPALAYGNCVIFKPSPLAPGSAHMLAEIIVNAGIPAGVFNLLVADGADTGAAIVNHSGVDAISFTGSQATGKTIAASAINRMAKFQLEMGGKNPLLISADADINVAVECAVQGAYFSTGQRCTASSRLIVDELIHDEFVDALLTRLATLRTGHALAEGTHIGPVVDAVQMAKDLEYIDVGKAQGATLLCGGERLSRDTQGFYLSPALFVDTDNNMRINREEIFGPVASVIKADDYEHGLQLCNDTDFGLSAGIVTTSLKTASHFKQHAQAGMVMVNAPTAGVDYHVPFGGRKASSYGAREQGSYAKEFYSHVKTCYTAP